MDSGVLVLGAGFLGSAIAEQLEAANHRVTLASRSAAGKAQGGSLARTSYVPLDLVSVEAASRLRELLGDHETCVYAVGALYPAAAERSPWSDLQASLAPLFATLQALQQSTCRRFIFLSSGGTVYGDHGAKAVTESCARVPLSSYGIGKLTAELYISEHCRTYPTQSVAVRVANAYGPGQFPGRGQGAVAAFLEAALTGVPAPLFGGGSTVRDYVHVWDVATAIAALVKTRDLPPAVNIGTGVGTSLSQLVTLVGKATGRSVPLLQSQSRIVDLPHNVLDPALARQLLGWTPRGLEEGILDTWQWFQQRSSMQSRVN